MRRELSEARDRGAKVGIPRALYYYYHPGLWEEFFRCLGMRPVVSRPTTGATLERAGLLSEAEHCLPLKLLDAHLSEIVGSVDIVFVPRILSCLRGHISCPKLGALPDAARAEIARNVPVATLELNEDRMPLRRSLGMLARDFGVRGESATRACDAAIDAMDRTRSAMASGCACDGNGVLILGHPYSLFDEYVSGIIVRKLELMGVNARFIRFDGTNVPECTIRWDTCSKMHHALSELSRSECMGVIQLSSFNCGCDSVSMEIFRGLLREKGIPYMVLVLDEHTAPAGVDTRLEAFVDSTRW